MTATDLTGTLGVALLLLAFALNLANTLKKDQWPYLALNTAGAGLACLASLFLQYWPFIILEGCWATVSAIGLMRAVQKRK